MTIGAQLPRNTTAALLVAILAVTAALFAVTFHSSGPGMDEGTLVTYPDLVLRGEVPGRDFETFYGPGGPYLMAGTFEIFGEHVSVERAVGLSFRLAIVAALFLLLLYWGWVAATAGSLISALLMLPLGVSAVDWFGAIGCALLGLAMLAQIARRDEPKASLVLVLAGLASGVAIVFRPDIGPAVVLSSLPLWLTLERGNRVRYLLGLLAGVLPAIAWLAAVGPHRIGRLLDDLSASRPGRRLPLPSPVSALGQVLYASIATTIGLLATAAFYGRRKKTHFETRLLLSFGLFSLAILPSALERADDAHILGVGCVAVALIPALVAFALPRLQQSQAVAIRTVSGWAALGLIALLGLTALVHAGGPTVKTEVLGIGTPDQAFQVENEGRSFPIESPGVARGLNHLLPEVDDLSRPGDSVFVGPLDLRRTKYADTYLYYLLPHFSPASFYTELNPGAANSADSGLAQDLRSADVLLLTSYYDSAEEDNASSEPGSAAPERVLHRLFCQVDQAGSYHLYRRCQA